MQFGRQKVRFPGVRAPKEVEETRSGAKIRTRVGTAVVMNLGLLRWCVLHRGSVVV